MTPFLRIFSTFAIAAQLLLGAPTSHAEDLIPRKLLFDNPQRGAPFISPDGTKIAFAAPLNGVMNIWVASIGDLTGARAVTREAQRPIMKFVWAHNSRHLLYFQDRAGDENFHIYAVDLESNSVKDLTPQENVRAELIAKSPERPDEFLLGLNDRDPRWHDVWLVNLVTGSRKLVQRNVGYASFLADHNLDLRVAVKANPDGSRDIYKRFDSDWTLLTKIPAGDVLTTEPWILSADGQTLYLSDSRNRNTSALAAIDLASQKQKILLEDSRADISHAIIDPKNHKVQAAGFEYDRMTWQAIDGHLKSDIKYLSKQVSGFWFVLSQSDDNSRWTVWMDNPGEPIKFGFYDRDSKTLTRLFTARPNLEGKKLPTTTTHIIKSRDGLDLVSYLTIPVEKSAGTDGVPRSPLPMVLMVHGGPWDRDSIAYNPYASWLANRGYAVLRVNFRGSTGFGKAFVNAGDREWGRAMQNDLLDAVEWAEERGIAQPGRTAIFGASYGGYATLAALSSVPERFACGVDIVGPSNLATMLANFPVYWESYVETLKQRIGDPSTSKGRKLLRERSPVFRAHKIKRPLLIGHGANDQRVKQSEAEQIVKAMKRKKLPVTLALYSDEGHGFARPQNRLSFNAITEQFLGQCLNGKAEPIGKDFNQSSVTVPYGKEHISGLAQALAQP